MSFMKPMPLLLSLLIATVAPCARATLHITSEQPVAELSPAPPEGPQWLGAIATDGTDSLVFWNGMAGFYATPVKADGQVGSRVLITLSGVSGISACWTGSLYLTAWHDDGDNAIHAAALSRDGEVVTSPYVVVANAKAASGSLASNGRRSLLAYTIAGSAVKGAMFDANGAFIAADLPLPVSLTSYGDMVPRVATDGNEFALVWRTSESVPIGKTSIQSIPPPLSELFHTFHLLRVSDLGAPIGAAITVARTEQTGDAFGIAYGGGVYAISATEGHLIAPGQSEPRLVRFTLDPHNGTVTTFPAVDNAGGSGVLWNGRVFIAYSMIYSQSAFELITLPFNLVPETIAPQPVIAMNGTHLGTSPLLGWNGTNVLGAWSEDLFGQGAGESAIRGAIFNADAATPLSGQSPFLISIGWSRQFTPAIATSGSESLIVWIQSSEVSTGRLVGMRVAIDGTPIDSTPFEIAPEASVSHAPVVTFAGVSYLVLWQELNGSGMVARRIGRDGSLGSRMPLGGSAAAVASNALETLVVLNASLGLVGYRFDPEGERIDSMAIGIADAITYSFHVATNGTDFLVVWNVGSDSIWLGPPPPGGNADLIDVYGARVTASGSVDAAPLPIATGPSDQFVEAVGSDGRDYTVFFGLSNQNHPHTILAAKRVLREGQLDGTTAQDDGTIVGDFVEVESIVANGGGFWLGGVNAAYPASSIVLLHTDFHGNAAEPTLLASSNSVLLLSPFVSLTQASGGPLQIAYARRLADGQYATTSRVFFRVASEPGQARSRAAHH